MGFYHTFFRVFLLGGCTLGFEGCSAVLIGSATGFQVIHRFVQGLSLRILGVLGLGVPIGP